jgi:DNA-binding GntR family transcriptional regulator
LSRHAAVPEYQRAADVIKSRVKLGDSITIPQIQETAGTTYSTARRTADHLANEGILRAHPGKGYEVIAAPQDAAGERAGVKELTRQLGQLRDEARALSAQVERIESNLEDLYDKLGFAYATDGSGERGEDLAPAARRGHTG